VAILAAAFALMHAWLGWGPAAATPPLPASEGTAWSRLGTLVFLGVAGVAWLAYDILRSPRGATPDHGVGLR
jgi:hypothetical protein